MYFEKSRDSRGEWRWALYAANGETIAVSSEGYKREAACDHAISLIKGGATDAFVRNCVVVPRQPVQAVRLPLARR